MTDFIKKNKRVLMIIVAILIFGGPIFIHIMFLIPSPFPVITPDLKESDVVMYYGTIVTFLSTMFLGYIAIKQSNDANQLSKYMLENDLMNKKSFLKLDVEESYYLDANGAKRVNFKFVNVTDTPIVDINLYGSDRVLVNDIHYINPEGEVAFITKYNYFGCDVRADKESCLYGLWIDDYKEPVWILSFKAIIESIYGFKTIQYFNVTILQGKIVDCKTIAES
jgi:hypothetical protein